MRLPIRLPHLAITAALLAAGCGASGGDRAASGAPAPTDNAGSGGSGGGSSINGGPGSTADASAPPSLPPEQHVERNFRAPVATTRYIWAANPDTGRVAQINAMTYGIRTIEAGNGPRYLAAVPNPSGSPDDLAVVLNTLSDDATLLVEHDGALTAKSFAVAAGHNAWSLSKDGRWAIAWTDAAQAKAAAAAAGMADPTKDPAMGFQDVSIVDLTDPTPKATILTVGYRPSAVAFADGAPRAFAVTEDGISSMSLAPSGSSALEKNIPYAADDAAAKPSGVAITPAGDYAFVRRDASAEVTVIDLATGAPSVIVLPAPVTDFVLTQAGDRAVAMMRDTSQVAVMPVPAVAATPAFDTVTVTGETIGSVVVAPGSSRAILYTTAVPAERLTVMALDGAHAYQTRKLHAPPYAVYATDDGKHALVIHGDFSGVDLDGGADGGDAGSPSAAPSFSIVPLDADKPARIQSTEVPPQVGGVALSPNGDRALLTVRDDHAAVYAVYVAKMPSLAVDRYALASPPMSVGVIAAANKAFVAQEHPEGRITFIDLATDEVRTLTGFELGARVVNGGQP